MLAGIASTLGTPAIASAQTAAPVSDWPKGMIKFVVPFPPGGSTDPVARLIQTKVMETPAGRS